MTMCATGIIQSKPSLGRESQCWAVHAVAFLDPWGASVLSAVFSLWGGFVLV